MTAEALTPLSTPTTGAPTIADTPIPLEDTPTQAPSAPTETLSFTPTPLFTAAPVSLLPPNLTIEGMACIPVRTQQDLAIVLKVIDGDTIQVILNGKKVIVTYIGVAAPAMPSGSRKCA